MAPKRTPPAAPHSNCDNAHAERIERLIDAVEAVAGQIEVLRNIIDEIREEFQWAVRNDRLPPHVVHVTSMPRDPLASRAEWAAKLNRINACDLQVNDSISAPEEAEDDESAPPSGSAKPGHQKTLWE